MTCIVGMINKDKSITMGGDSAGVTGDFRITPRKDTKVFINGDYIIGFTTSFRMGQVLQNSVKLPSPPKSDKDLYKFMVTKFVNVLRKCYKSCGYLGKDKEGREDGGTFLVGVRGRLFKISDDFQVGEGIEPFSACGCGEVLATGALHILANHKTSIDRPVLAALQVAERYHGGVSGPFNILKLPYKKIK